MWSSATGLYLFGSATSDASDTNDAIIAVIVWHCLTFADIQQFVFVFNSNQQSVISDKLSETNVVGQSSDEQVVHMPDVYN